MQTIDSGACRTSSGAAGQASATQGLNFKGSHGSLQDRADQLVRATVLSDLGQSVGGHGRHGHASIQGIAAAVRKVLSGQDVTGTDAADDVLKKIETSLHKAAQALADRGVDAKTIDATIDKFRSQLANALDGVTQGAASGASEANGSSGSGSTDGASGSGGASASGSTAGSSGTTAGTGTSAPSTAPATSVTSVSKFVAREVRKERGAIDLVTAEGDRVSIRFRTKEVVSGSVTQSTASDGTTTTAAKASVFSRGGVKIEVDGDLNEDELKAIGDLLGKVDDIATKFFSGDVQAAFSAASSLGVDSDQIAAYRLNLTYSRKVATAYGAWGASLPAATQPPASTGDGTTAAGSATDSTSATSGSADGSSGSGSGNSTSAPASSATSGSGSTPASTDSATTTSGSSGASASDSASGNGASAGTTAGDAGASNGTTDGATDGTGTPATGTSTTPPATTPPASAQKTIIDFISDALSKLNSTNGAGRLSFSMQWKMSLVVTAIQSVQPAQPTNAADQAAAANTQLLGDSLQKIAAA